GPRAAQWTVAVPACTTGRSHLFRGTAITLVHHRSRGRAAYRGKRGEPLQRVAWSDRTGAADHDRGIATRPDPARSDQRRPGARRRLRRVGCAPPGPTIDSLSRDPATDSARAGAAGFVAPDRTGTAIEHARDRGRLGCAARSVRQARQCGST